MTEPAETGRRDENRLVGVISLAHAYSHFSHLMAAPLFPWLKDAFALSYAELGLVMTVFFVVSGVAQALSGFVVDRFGAMPVLLAAIGLFVLAAGAYAVAPSYPMLLAAGALAGLGNAPFHPIDYSILNARVRPERLGHAYAVHGIAGNVGWAVAPMLLVGVATVAGWRWAFASAGLLAAIIWLVVWWHRGLLDVRVKPRVAAAGQPAPEHALAFLRIPAVWMSFLFFVTYAIALGGVQSFGPEAAGQLHTVPRELIALCLTAYMVASASGMITGGFLVRKPGQADKVIGLGFGGAMVVALVIGLVGFSAPWVPVLFGLMGFGAGIAGPSRDLLVKAATPPGATGRVYGMVYSGLDIGMSCAPAVFGLMMDAKQPTLVWIGIAFFQGLMILSVLKLGRTVRKPVAVTADAAA